jgi:hypothetical protein
MRKFLAGLLLLPLLLRAEPFYLPLEEQAIPVHQTFERWYGSRGIGLLEEIFVPLGWEGERRFAYLRIPANEARDCSEAILTVQDLSTDRILHRSRMELCPPREGRHFGTLEQLRLLERLHRPRIDKVLARYRIASPSRRGLRPFPIRRADASIEYLLETSRRTAPGYSLEDLFLRSWRLDLLRIADSGLRRIKTLHRQRYREFSGLYDLRVLGYVPSPGFHRIAILLLGVRRGWEGPPHTTLHYVVGASLTGGWKR